MLIPANRLRKLPETVRLAHEYSFFLHDEFVRMLVEYEAANATEIRFEFASKAEGKRLKSLSKKHDTITAMRELGLHAEVRRVILNQITMAMVSDCGHHIYEALMCFEKRKFIPGFNLLRKPLLDSLMYLSWIVADEDGFYAAFTSGDPTKITQKMIGNRRNEIFCAAIAEIQLSNIVSPEVLRAILFEDRNPNGLYRFFQHAVHLVTVDRVELRTYPENFNFIFKHPYDNDIYEVLYAALPTVLLYLSHLILTLYGRIKPMDDGAKQAFLFRTVNAYRFLYDEKGPALLAEVMNDLIAPHVQCTACSTPLKATAYNAFRLLLTDSFRCNKCRRKQLFPLSWLF